MRSGAVSGRTDGADGLAGFDVLADSRENLRAMAVARGYAVAVVDDDEIAVSAVGAGRHDATAGCCADLQNSIVVDPERRYSLQLLMQVPSTVPVTARLGMEILAGAHRVFSLPESRSHGSGDRPLHRLPAKKRIRIGGYKSAQYRSKRAGDATKLCRLSPA